jgi:protein TonB
MKPMRWIGAALVFAWCGSGFAAEEARVPFSAAEEFVAKAPLYYSYESGQWVSVSPGNLFTTGDTPGDFELPHLKESPAPILYPRWAVSRNWEGLLVVAVEVLPDGKVGRWQIMKSSGRKILDLAAVKCIRKWRFEPAKKRGRPIVSCIQVPVRFKIAA